MVITATIRVSNIETRAAADDLAATLNDARGVSSATVDAEADAIEASVNPLRARKRIVRELLDARGYEIEECSRTLF